MPTIFLQTLDTPCKSICFRLRSASTHSACAFYADVGLSDTSLGVIVVLELTPKTSARCASARILQAWNRSSSKCNPIYNKARFVNLLHKGHLRIAQLSCAGGRWFGLRECGTLGFLSTLVKKLEISGRTLRSIVPFRQSHRTKPPTLPSPHDPTSRRCSLSLSEILSPVAFPLPLPKCSPVVSPTMVPSLSPKVSGQPPFGSRGLAELPSDKKEKAHESTIS